VKTNIFADQGRKEGPNFLYPTSIFLEIIQFLTWVLENLIKVDGIYWKVAAFKLLASFGQQGFILSLPFSSLS